MEKYLEYKNNLKLLKTFSRKLLYRKSERFLGSGKVKKMTKDSNKVLL